MNEGRPKLLCSFSGGKTSAYMSYILNRDYSAKYDICYVFANTGQEREETLEFVRDVDAHFGLGVVWVEAVVSPELKAGTRHKIVDFASACRDTSLFAPVCEKYGIPNAAAPHCTRELKQHPIHSYMRSIGWGASDYKTAIGIRTDEEGRIKSGRERGFVYPLVDWFPTDKQDIETYWEDMPFSLNLKSYEGNCSWCWKKSEAKLYRLATEKPHLFLAPLALEMTYGKCGPKFRKDPQAPSEVFFRGRCSAQDILIAAQEWAANGGMKIPVRERGGSDGCTESCEFALVS